MDNSSRIILGYKKKILNIYIHTLSCMKKINCGLRCLLNLFVSLITQIS